ncbi:rCG20661, isoform CRA_a, partial [Rattus norvegicus]
MTPSEDHKRNNPTFQCSVCLISQNEIKAFHCF